MADLRGARLSMIFQEPMTSLNPVMSIGRQIMEPMVRHQRVSALPEIPGMVPSPLNLPAGCAFARPS